MLSAIFLPILSLQVVQYILHIKSERCVIMIQSIKRVFDRFDSKSLTNYYKSVKKINDLEPEMQACSDEELRNKTQIFKDRLVAGETIFDMQEEAFALVREASVRVLGLRHYDVQMIGGLALLTGDIAEMPTGEGKTLVASLPCYLRALEGKGVHVITVNEYLASRDKEQIAKVHEFLGLTVGLNISQMEAEEKREAYVADITYGVGTEFGFDYLRDQLVTAAEERVCRPYHYAIIDEIDSVLIDEAKTPLIIAGKKEGNASLYGICSELITDMVLETDFTFDPKTKACAFTDEGISKIEEAFELDNLYDLDHRSLYHFLLQALRAKMMFKKDVDYIIDEENKIALVDMFTGRIMHGRTLSEGLHQAIEAKEHVEITEENQTVASITIQNFFRLYPILCGMTGTAKTEEKEFLHVYNMRVIQIPTNRKVIRKELPDTVYKTIAQKDKAILNVVKDHYKRKQPVLIGTTSILQSERIAKMLTENNIKFQLLNAKTVEQEVDLISKAGQLGQITIATNMAGRGTDILLGEGVPELGGLHVLGTERHESRRIDNQLKGRSGRQGDPGSAQFIVSLEDEMFTRFAEEELEKLMKTLQTDEEGKVLNKNIKEFIDRTQRICEGSNYSVREYNLKIDDITRSQNEVVYAVREQLLTGENIAQALRPYTWDVFEKLIETTTADEELYEEWPLEDLCFKIEELLDTPVLMNDSMEFTIREELTTFVKPIFDENMDKFEDILNDEEKNQAIRRTLLSILDYHWIHHIEDLSHLKDGIGIRQYGQEDPVRLFEFDSFELFKKMFFTLIYELTASMSSTIAYFDEYGLEDEEEIEFDEEN